MQIHEIELELLSRLKSIPVVDAHEHLPCEAKYLEGYGDVFSLILGAYVGQDIASSGVKESDRDIFNDRDRPLDQRWRAFEPYWQLVRHGSYARTAILTARDYYDVEGIDANSIHVLDERIWANRTAGIYKRVNDSCNIKMTISQSGSTDTDLGFRSIMPILDGVGYIHHRNPEAIKAKCAAMNMPVVKDIDGMTALWSHLIASWHDAGVVGVKIQSKYIEEPNKDLAQQELLKMLAGDKPDPNQMYFNHLDNLIIQHSIEQATKHDMVVAAHSGVWRDYRALDPKHMLVLAVRYPQARFDLYHLGMPDIRDSIMVAKTNPNVNLNLCWAHSLSQMQTRAAVEEILDQVPISKVIAFGGDYCNMIENVVGHLRQAKENFANAFACRIARAWMTIDDAQNIITQWFWNNPMNYYNITETAE